MNTKSIKDRLLSSSQADDKWKKEAKYRIENEDWLDISFSIAVKILAYMKVNNVNQKELSVMLDVTPQYISKLLKGKQPLGLPTIGKMQRILKIKLLEVPKDYDLPPQVNCNIFVSDSTVKFKQEQISYEQSTNTFQIWKPLKNSPADC